MSLESMMKERDDMEAYKFYYYLQMTEDEKLRHDEIDYEIEQELRR